MSAAARADETVAPWDTKLGKADWSMNASPNLERTSPSKDAVQAFVFSLETTIRGESLLGDATEICSFRFADLRHDGFLSLIYGIDTIDRPSNCATYVVDKTPPGFELYIGAGGALEKVEDLGKDGKTELVLDTGLGPERLCYASWKAIYSWTGKDYTNVSDQFKDFYRARLDAINQTLAKLGRTPGPDDYSVNDKECLMAEASAIQRFLGNSPDAGIDQALRLAKSPDCFERRFGTELLKQIGGPIARKYLEILVKDPDYGVASYAKSSRSGSSHGYKYAPAAFKRLP